MFVVGIIDSSAEVSTAPQEVVGVVLFAVGFCYIIMVRRGYCTYYTVYIGTYIL